MYLYKSAESTVSEAALIRTVLRGHTAKRLARLMGLSLRTARHWLYYGPAASRRRDLALALLEELDREEAEERLPARHALTLIAGVRE